MRSVSSPRVSKGLTGSQQSSLKVGLLIRLSHFSVPLPRTQRQNAGESLQGSPAFLFSRPAFDQKVNFTASCTWRGSPTPWRRKPSKLNNPGVVSGLIRLSLLKVLNISTEGISAKRSPPKRMRLDRLQSNEKYSLSLRAVLRLVAVRT